MAANEQPSHRRRRWIVVALVFIALVALGFPASAGAHPSALVNALDFRAVVGSVGRSGDGLSARIFDADRKIELSVPASTTVVVLGYAGEPFLRFAPIGVEMNERSLLGGHRQQVPQALAVEPFAALLGQENGALVSARGFNEGLERAHMQALRVGDRDAAPD